MEPERGPRDDRIPVTLDWQAGRNEDYKREELEIES